MQPSPLILPYQGKTPDIHPTAYIAPNAVIIGDVKIGEGSSIWFNCVLRADVNPIRIGKFTNIQDGTIIHESSPSSKSSTGYDVTIGDYVTVGHLALIHACTICDHALIGMKACVMDGCVIGESSMIGAGSLVPPRKEIPSGQLWIGSPAQFIRTVSDEDKKELKRMNDVYIRMTPEYKAG